MPGQCDLEVRSAITVIVVHLGHVLNELGLRLAIATHPIFIDLSISIVILSVNMIFVDQSVSIVVLVVHRAVVDIVVRTVGITHPGE